MVKEVRLSKQAQKHLKKLPLYIVDKLFEWVDSVENEGLEETRKCKGFHDEPLLGQRRGQRSIRLSKSYRAIYIVVEGRTAYCEVKEVSKHAY